MKIDIHVHTKKVKSGDAETRNINSETFGNIIKETDVKIIAITNHNHFDKQQYEEFTTVTKNELQIWAGIELDIFENDKRAHLIVIVNPKNYEAFDKKVTSILQDKNPDTFTISIKETVECFDDLDCIYIAHYFGKSPNLGDEEIELLSKSVSNPKRILKEASNSISAGIFISHGHNSIYGSDVQNWNNYISDSKNLPELRLPVESYEQFCLLLEKDEITINTLLNKKVKESIELVPFTVAEMIKIDIYNDINILFGSKGTGKTDILDSLSKYYNNKGFKTNVYKSNDIHLGDVFDIKGNSFQANCIDYEIDECEDEISFIRNATEKEITSLSKYSLHFSSEETNKISKKLKIKEIAKIDEQQYSRKLEEVFSVFSEFRKFRDYITEHDKIKEFIEDDLINQLNDIFELIISKLLTETENKFIESKSIDLLNNIVNVIQIEISKKTGLPVKPLETGFANYANNRIKIARSVDKILSNINIQINPIITPVGSLGYKGELYCQTNLFTQNGSITDSNYSPVKNVNKRPQKEFTNVIKIISKHIYSHDLFEKITMLNDIENINTISGLSDLLLFYKHFTLNNQKYNPSNGESSMVLLQKELLEDKEIYLIDEPEKSLGNDYINDVIVPLLKEKALLGKKVVIATHDANIAVRTLPYNSIYRLHDMNQYFTLTGNPFSNKLKCIYGLKSELDWKEISMKTLEGGRDAFGERGKIYGN